MDPNQILTTAAIGQGNHAASHPNALDWARSQCCKNLAFPVTWAQEVRRNNGIIQVYWAAVVGLMGPFQALDNNTSRWVEIAVEH